MNYAVEWVTSAEGELATLWLNESLRPLLARATTAFDARLQRDPENVGESRDEGRRIEFESPFAIMFKCDSAARKVQVLSIWSY